MTVNYLTTLFYIALSCLCFQASTVHATERRIQGTIKNLQSFINKAQSGDRIIFSTGRYSSHLIIDKSLALIGESGAILDGNFSGDVIRVRAANVVIKNLRIENSGHDLTEMNAGVFVEATADNILIENNEFNNNGFGIWLKKNKAAKVLNNRVNGPVKVRSQDRGNGIHMSSVTKALVKGNEVWNTRDGIYIESSNNNTLEDNVLHDLRYGIHYMYSQSNRLIGNFSYNNRTGYALMQSTNLIVLNNISKNDRNYGMLLNFITYSTIENNHIIAVTGGTGYVTGGTSVPGAEGKAIFIYNSQFNTITNNLFASCDIGIHLTAGSEDNKIYNNSFKANRVQVKYVANRSQDWTFKGRGNYWSDYLGWDLNADGIGDKQYEPNDAVDKLLWKYPMARVLLNSPVIETLRWVHEQFPVLKSQGVYDSAPLMVSPFNEESRL